MSRRSRKRAAPHICASEMLPLPVVPERGTAEWKVLTLCGALAPIDRCTPASDPDKVTCPVCLRSMVDDTLARLKPWGMTVPDPGWARKRRWRERFVEQWDQQRAGLERAANAFKTVQVTSDPPTPETTHAQDLHRPRSR